MVFQKPLSRQIYFIAVGLRLFQETLKPRKYITTRKSDEKETHFSRIQCPLCKWRPNPQSRWYCVACDYPEYFYHGCGTTWNTFTTRGRCPVAAINGTGPRAYAARVGRAMKTGMV